MLFSVEARRGGGKWDRSPEWRAGLQGEIKNEEDKRKFEIKVPGDDVGNIVGRWGKNGWKKKRTKTEKKVIQRRERKRGDISRWKTRLAGKTTGDATCRSRATEPTNEKCIANQQIRQDLPGRGPFLHCNYLPLLLALYCFLPCLLFSFLPYFLCIPSSSCTLVSLKSNANQLVNTQCLTPRLYFGYSFFQFDFFPVFSSLLAFTHCTFRHLPSQPFSKFL